MNEKAMGYIALQEEASRTAVSTHEEWERFLRLASKMYKYSFPDQLMIYAQRPDATACAEYRVWNKRMHRAVRRGAKGIALVYFSGSYPKLRYVFDYADTYPGKDARSLYEWKNDDEHACLAQSIIESRHADLPKKADPEECFQKAAVYEVLRYFSANKERISGFLGSEASESFKKSFIETASESVSYILAFRCLGKLPTEELERFKQLGAFDDARKIIVLGTCVAEISGNLLNEIRLRTDEYERRRKNGIEVYEERGLSCSEHQPGTNGGDRGERIHQDETGVSGEGETGASQLSDDEEPAACGSDGNGQTMQEGIGKKGRKDGRRNRNGNQEAYQQIDMFSSESEQIELIEGHASGRKPIRMFKFRDEEIERILIYGSNLRNGRSITAAEYMKGRSIPEIAERLKKCYLGGFGLIYGNRRIAAWYGGEGIRVARGDKARHRPEQTVTWTEAAEMIKIMLEQGRFATQDELEKALPLQRRKVSERLIHIYQDLGEKGRSMNLLSLLEDKERTGSFQDKSDHIAGCLADPAFVEKLSDQYAEFMTELEKDRNVMRLRCYDFNDAGKELQELLLPFNDGFRSSFEAEKPEMFITQDEIDADLAGGSMMSGGKNRILDFFIGGECGERADFLKKEYGIGGKAPALSGNVHSGSSHDSKGIRYDKAGCEDVVLSWNRVAEIIDRLISDYQYASEAEVMAAELRLEEYGAAPTIDEGYVNYEDEYEMEDE